MFRLIIYGFFAAILSSSALYMLLTSNLGLNDIKVATVEKMTNSIMDDLNMAMPMIEEAGYSISGLEAELSLPPEVTTSFELIKVVDKKKQKQILDSLKSNRIGELVLSSLMQAFALNKNVSIKDMQLKAIEITISLPPYVTIQYEK